MADEFVEFKWSGSTMSEENKIVQIHKLIPNENSSINFKQDRTNHG